MPGKKESRKLERAKKHISKQAVAVPASEKGFIRALGTFDKVVRDKALDALTVWLSKRKDLSESDLNRLWKGMFFCFWHSDKAPVQEDLAERLAAVMTKLPEDVAFLFFQVFLSTMRREWYGIDRLRLDKFMMLVRKFVHQIIAILAKGGWEEEAVSKFCETLSDRVLAADDKDVALGVSLHIADIYIEELQSINDAIPAATLELLMEPWHSLMEAPMNRALLIRTEQEVWRALAGACAEGATAFALCDCGSIADKLVEAAGEEDTPSKNREVLFLMAKLFSKAERARQDIVADVGGSGGKRKRPVHSVGAGEEGSGAETGEKVKKAGEKDNGAPKSGGKRARAERDVQGARDSAAARDTLEEPGPPSSKKIKKKGKKISAEEDGDGATTPAPRLQAPGSAHAKHATPEPSSNLEGRFAAALAGSGGGAWREPSKKAKAALAAAAAAATPGSGSKKGRVRFSLKRNIEFKPNSPRPPDVTTPSTTPKGSALKRVSNVSSSPRGGGTPGPAGGSGLKSAKSRKATPAPKDRAGAGAGRQALTPKSPKGTPRASAADFF